MRCTSAGSAATSGLGLTLAGFVALVFGLTIAKVSDDEFAVPTEEAGS